MTPAKPKPAKPTAAKPAPKEPDFTKIMELWVASDLKVQALVFFHDNPGVIETMDGLAKRLGTTVERLRKELAGHIELGLIKQEKAGKFTLLVFDRKREDDVQSAIAAHLHKLAAANAKVAV